MKSSEKLITPELNARALDVIHQCLVRSLISTQHAQLLGTAIDIVIALQAGRAPEVERLCKRVEEMGKAPAVCGLKAVFGRFTPKGTDGKIRACLLTEWHAGGHKYE